ncbi:MAG TPA: DUF308 domain-containing protein [Solirubrobacteraceae bacterium]|nr:DUF308 domain-containing protein [Solirubrobacteraceae bacterium]
MFTSLLTKTSSPGHLTFLGLLAGALGVAAIVWPGVTVGVAVALFAIYCFVNAIGQLVAMFTVERKVGRDVLRLLLAVIDVAAGVVAIVYPSMTAEVLTIIVGFWAIFGGTVELTGAFTGRSGWLGVAGLLTIAAGVVLIAWPGIGAVSLALIFGVYLLAYGITLLVAAAKAAGRPHLGAKLHGGSAAA